MPPHDDAWLARHRTLVLDRQLEEALAEPEITAWLDDDLTAERLRTEVLARADAEIFPAAAPELEAWAELVRSPGSSALRITVRRRGRLLAKATLWLLAAFHLGSPVVGLVWALIVADPAVVLRRVGVVALSGLAGLVVGSVLSVIARQRGEDFRITTVNIGVLFAFLPAFWLGAGFIGGRLGSAFHIEALEVALPVMGFIYSIMAGLIAGNVLYNTEPDGGLAKAADRASATEQAESRWERQLRENGLMPFLRAAVTDAVDSRYAQTLRIRGGAPGLRTHRATDYHVATPATERLLGLLDDLDGGSFALAGARGSGKTMLLHALRDGRHRTEDSPRDLVVVVPVPVEYASRDFAIHLCLAVCEAAESYFAPHMKRSWRAPATIVQTMQKQRDELRYLQSGSREWSGKVAKAGGEVAFKKAASRQALPMTYPEIVSFFHKMLGQISLELKHLGDPPPKLIIGIDELDRIGSAESVERFLNDIKGVFGEPGCHFVVSVSEDALRAFELAGHGVRDVFDSTFDEMIRVEHLTFANARDLLGRRVAGLSEQFAALAYCLAGGLPRQLIRIAREMTRHHDGFLPDVTRALVRQQLDRIRHAHATAEVALFRLLDDPPSALTAPTLLAYAADLRATPTGNGPATHVEFLATVVSVFDAGLDAGRTKNAAAGFDALARVRRYLGADDAIAATLLDGARRTWGLNPCG
ncbi:hypothetical protein [Actinoplanes sp. HUAS TT8]|uniref:hypothetical protein n=1 Tax=Actinoplanes sp. HUAS TT8 TaxID=3447453 RepID=UPI003F51E8F1